jgi:hypothetical protein
MTNHVANDLRIYDIAHVQKVFEYMLHVNEDIPKHIE